MRIHKMEKIDSIDIKFWKVKKAITKRREIFFNLILKALQTLLVYKTI